MGSDELKNEFDDEYEQFTQELSNEDGEYEEDLENSEDENLFSDSENDLSD